MTKHTPGCWTVDYAETGVRWPVVVVKDSSAEGGLHEIAEISDHVARRTASGNWRAVAGAGEAEANAFLISAAPELKAVVLGFRQKLARYVDVYPGDKELRRLLDECDAAIAKAEGR